MLKPAQSVPEISTEKRVQEFLVQIDAAFKPVLDDDEYYLLSQHLSKSWVGLLRPKSFIHRKATIYDRINMCLYNLIGRL